MQAALVVQPDGQANQLALCYASEAAKAANAVNPDKEPSMVVTVALANGCLDCAVLHRHLALGISLCSPSFDTPALRENVASWVSLYVAIETSLL